MNKLRKLYTDILEYCSMHPNDNGEISLSLTGDDYQPVMIEGRRLVLPTDEQLRKFDPEKVVVFHPLQEHVNRGESEIVKALRYQLNVRINYTTMILAAELLTLVASVAEHRNLTPEQRELLLEVKSGDIAVAARFTEFCLKYYSDKSPENKGMATRLFSNIYLKKAGTFEGKKHSRVGVVQFPIYELLNNPDTKLKKGDKEIFESLINFIFPGSKDENEAYNNFSDNRDAPWLDCLLKTADNLTSRLNELIELYAPYIKDAEKFKFEDVWRDGMENLEDYRNEIRMIPVQRGNEGTVEREGSQESSAKPIPTPPPADKREHWTPPAEKSVYNVAPPMQQRPMQPMPMQQPMQPMPMQPMQQQPMQQPGPGLIYTPDGKLDFNSIERTNPMVAASAFVSTPITEWQRAQAMQQQMQMMQMNPMHPAVAANYHPPMMGMHPGQMYQDPRMAGMQQMPMQPMPMMQPMQQGYPQQMQQPMPYGYSISNI